MKRIGFFALALWRGAFGSRWRTTGLIKVTTLKQRVHREYLDLVDPWSNAEQDVYMRHPLIPRKNRRIVRRVGTRTIRHRRSFIDRLARNGIARPIED